MKNTSHQKKLIYFLFTISLLFVFSCSQRSFQSSSSNLEIATGSHPQAAQDNPTTDQTNPPVSNPSTDNPSTNPVDPVEQYLPLAWEKKVPGSQKWSLFIYHTILNNEKQMLADHAATDVEIFCPNFQKLSQTQRLNFWGQLLAGIAKFESSWNPISRYLEPSSMGKDGITGLPVVSEGLLQLSYQDGLYHGAACLFDWSKDKLLQIKNPADPLKTILDPYKNLRCGIQILAHQLEKHHAIVIDKGVYWAVIRKNNNSQKIDKIAAYTKALPFCVR